MTLPVPHPGYEHAGANRDIPKALPSSGMALRSALARAGAVSVAAIADFQTDTDVQATVDASLADYPTTTEMGVAIAAATPAAASTTASTAGWAGNLNGVTGNVQAALDAFDDATLGGTPADGSITMAKLADLAQDKIIGRATASTGVPEAIACTAAGRALLDDATNTDQRTTLGLGTAAVAATGDFAAATHATAHKSGGGDAIKLDELAAPTDITTLNASTGAHGLLPKLDNNSGNFLNGQGAWAAPTATVADGSITLAKMANLAQDAFIIRTTGSTGVPETATCTAAGRAILDDTTAAAQRTTLGIPTDLVFTKVGADTAVNNAADQTIVTTDVTGVAAGDQVIVDAWFVILNNSTATRVYTITLDFDAAFDIEFATGACATSATLMHPFHVQGVCDIRASNLAYAVNQITGWTAAGVAAGGDVTIVATPLIASSWGTSTSDLTGTLTVALKIRSANNTATQTCRLHSFTVRKVTPT